jgi:hypothetical protein
MQTINAQLYLQSPPLLRQTKQNKQLIIEDFIYFGTDGIIYIGTKLGTLVPYQKTSSSSTSATWGNITGTLSNQTDLQDALNAKQALITLGTTAQYFRGDLSLATFPTSLSSFTNDPGYITASSSDTLTNKSGLISQWTNDVGYLTSVTGYVPTSRNIGTTAPLSGGGNLSADLTLSITKANTTTDGYLSHTDWNTFNGKQAAITTGTTAQYFRGDLSLATFPTNVSSFTNDAGYLTANQSITLSGGATGTGTTSITVSLTNTSVTGQAITGYVSGAGTISATDSVLSAIEKLNGNIGALTTGVSSVNLLTGAVPLTGTANHITISSSNVFDIGSSVVTLTGSQALSNKTGNISQWTNDSGYLTANQSITLSGNVTGSGTTSIATTIGAGVVTNAMLAGSIAASKLVGTDIATVGTITSGTWNGTAISSTYGGTGINTSASTGIAQVAAGVWSISTALVNGTIATTQSVGSNDTKVATDAYVDNISYHDAHLTLYPANASSTTQGTWVSEVVNELLNGDFYNSSVTINDQINFIVGTSAGTYTFNIQYFKGTNRGQIAFLLDGTSIGTADGYLSSAPTGAYYLTITGQVVTAGKHTLSIKVTGKNSSSSNYAFTFNLISLWRTS